MTPLAMRLLASAAVPAMNRAWPMASTEDRAAMANAVQVANARHGEDRLIALMALHSIATAITADQPTARHLHP